MTNLEYLENVKKEYEDYRINEIDEIFEYRQTKALEIIAEEKVKANDILRDIVTTLENIETAIKQR